MLFLLVFIIGVVLAALFAIGGTLFGTPGRSYDWGTQEVCFCWASILGATALIFLIIGLCFNLNAYSGQVNDNARIKQYTEVERIKVSQSKNLGASLKKVLTDTYPAYESKTIGKMVADSPSLLAVRFPDLKANTTFISYTENLVKLKREIYDVRIAAAQNRKEIAAREANHLLYITSLLP